MKGMSEDLIRILMGVIILILTLLLLYGFVTKIGAA